MKKAKENPIEVDKTKVVIILITLCLMVLISYSVFDNMKQNAIKTNKINICDEIDNLNSTLIKHVGDYVYINGKKYKYSDLKLQCELRKQTDLNSNYENQTINFNLT